MIQDISLSGQFSIGVFLEGKNLQVGLVKDMQVEKFYQKEINNREAEEVIIKEVMDAIDKVITPDVKGIGIGVPSMVDVAKGVVYNVEHIPSWREVHLGGLLTERYKVPVYVNNDANCFAVGEKYFGKGKKYANMVGVILGEGLGCGIIVNNRLYSGTNCGAGEIGYIPYKDHNYEYYCTTGYFDLKYGIKPEMLLTRARKDDKIALAILEQFGVDLGNAIKTIMYSFDPECIIMGGSIARFFPFFSTSMWKVVRTFQYEKSVEKLKIEVSDQEKISVLGAAALYYDAKTII
jgi:glucokinase